METTGVASTRSPFRDPLLAAESLWIRPGKWNSFFPAFPRLHQRDINQQAVVHPPAMIYCILKLRNRRFLAPNRLYNGTATTT